MKNQVLSSIFILSFITFAFAEQKEDQTKQTLTEEISSSLSLLKDHGALLGSMISILFSEVGDKTFIITAILSAKYNKFYVFLGSYGALFLMTFISCFIGNLSDYILPEKYIKIASAVLFFFFGFKSLYDSATNQLEDEDEEIETEIKALEEKLNQGNKDSIDDSTEDSKQEVKKVKGTQDTINSSSEPQVVQREQKQSETKQNNKDQSSPKVSNKTIAVLTFAQNFLGEWGDKSQLSTIAMGASFNFYKVFIGAALGHFCCSLLAITGGKYLAEQLSERTLTFLGGLLFVTYGCGTLYSSLI
ncbi:hypothetical protein ABPG74_016153 [Tetrahymena malaccensis]